YITGITNSSPLPIVGTVFQPLYGGGNTDAFVAQLNPTATALVYSTYLGGSNSEDGRGIAVDKHTPASAFVAGQTCSTDFPVARALQSNQAGNCDAFVSKLSVGPVLALSSATLTYTPEPIGVTSPAQTVTITSVGDTNLNIATVTKSGDFAISNDTCLGTSLPPGASCQIGVTFTPTATGTRGGTLTIT